MWLTAGLVVIGLVAATAFALSGDGGDDTAALQDEPDATSTTARPTTTTTVATTTTAAPTTGATHATTATWITGTDHDGLARGSPPGAVTVIQGRPGGGSGEIAVQWDAVAGAMGYRVLRSDAAGGPFAVAADYDVASGHATTVEDGITVWSPSGYPWIE